MSMSHKLKWLLAIMLILSSCQTEFQTTPELNSINNISSADSLKTVLENRNSHSKQSRSTSKSGYEILSTDSSGQMCSLENTTYVGTLPAGCDVTIVVTENDNPINTLINPAPGLYPVAHGCGCGDFHIRSVATLSGTCGPGELELSNYVVTVPCDDPGPSPTPTPTPTPSPSGNCEDSPTVSPQDMGQLIDGLSNPNGQSLSHNQNFSTQSINVFQTLNNKGNKNDLQVTLSANLARQQALEELDAYEQSFRQFVQSQPLLKANEILDAPAPLSFDGYRQQILEQIDQVRTHNASTHAELLIAANSHAKLKQTYIQLAKAHLNNQLLFDGNNSSWPTVEEKSAYDSDISNVLKSIHDSTHLLNYVDQQMNQLAKQLSNTQRQLAQEIQALFNDLGITPEQFTLEYYKNSQQQAKTAFEQAELAMEQFEQTLSPEGFSVQAQDSDGIVRKVYDNVKNKFYEYVANPTEQAYDAVKKSVKDGGKTIAKEAPYALVAWDQFVTPIENYLLWSPVAQTQQYLRTYMIGATCSLLGQPTNYPADPNHPEYPKQFEGKAASRVPNLHGIPYKASQIIMAEHGFIPKVTAHYTEYKHADGSIIWIYTNPPKQPDWKGRVSRIPANNNKGWRYNPDGTLRDRKAPHDTGERVIM